MDKRRLQVTVWRTSTIAGAAVAASPPGVNDRPAPVEPTVPVRRAVHTGTLGTGFGQRFRAANDPRPPVAVAA